MKFEVKNIAIAVILFVTGFLSGNALNFPIIEIYSTSDILSIFAILITATIGISALRSWKYQFQHIECYKAAINLELAATEYLQSFHDYRYAYLMAARHKGLKHEEMDKIPEYDVQKSSYMKYTKAWSLLLPFVSLKNNSLAACNPNELQKELFSLLKPIHYVFRNNYDPAKDSFDESIPIIKDNTISEIRSFRTAANK